MEIGGAVSRILAWPLAKTLAKILAWILGKILAKTLDKK
tara:strand:+ start:45 stop:161 length:117 start_codon:yes stop_codon:yes gene_type:complete